MNRCSNPSAVYSTIILLKAAWTGAAEAVMRVQRASKKILLINIHKEALLHDRAS